MSKHICNPPLSPKAGMQYLCIECGRLWRSIPIRELLGRFPENVLDNFAWHHSQTGP